MWLTNETTLYIVKPFLCLLTSGMSNMRTQDDQEFEGDKVFIFLRSFIILEDTNKVHNYCLLLITYGFL